MSYKLTKTFADSIPFPENGQTLYRDSEIKMLYFACWRYQQSLYC